MTKRTEEKIQELIETVICGNKIKGNTTYENMLKSISSKDLNSYAYMYHEDINSDVFWAYKKIDKIQIMAMGNKIH